MELTCQFSPAVPDRSHHLCCRHHHQTLYEQKRHLLYAYLRSQQYQIQHYDHLTPITRKQAINTFEFYMKNNRVCLLEEGKKKRINMIFPVTLFFSLEASVKEELFFCSFFLLFFFLFLEVLDTFESVKNYSLLISSSKETNWNVT